MKKLVVKAFDVWHGARSCWNTSDPFAWTLVSFQKSRFSRSRLYNGLLSCCPLGVAAGTALEHLTDAAWTKRFTGTAPNMLTAMTMYNILAVISESRFSRHHMSNFCNSSPLQALLRHLLCRLSPLHRQPGHSTSLCEPSALETGAYVTTVLVTLSVTHHWSLCFILFVLGLLFLLLFYWWILRFICCFFNFIFIYLFLRTENASSLGDVFLVPPHFTFRVGVSEPLVTSCFITLEIAQTKPTISAISRCDTPECW